MEMPGKSDKSADRPVRCTENGCQRATVQPVEAKSAAVAQQEGWTVSRGAPLGAWCPQHSPTGRAKNPGRPSPGRVWLMAVGSRTLRDRVYDAYVGGVMDLQRDDVPTPCLDEWSALKRAMNREPAASPEESARFVLERARAEELRWLARCTAFVLLHQWIAPGLEMTLTILPETETKEVSARCLALACDRETRIQMLPCSVYAPPRTPGWALSRGPSVVAWCPEHAQGKGSLLALRSRGARCWSIAMEMAATSEPLGDRVYRAFVSELMPLERADVPVLALHEWLALRSRLDRRSCDAAIVRAALDGASEGELRSHAAHSMFVLGSILEMLPSDGWLATNAARP
jgi:hypothetical protein